MKRINEIRLQIPNEKVFFIGAVCSGKTTVAKILKDVFGFVYLAIDDYRVKYSDGSLKGEKLAYQKFIQDVNSIESESPIVIECTGLSQYFEELNTKGCFIFHFEVSELEAKFRSVERDLSGYTHPPFPFVFNKITTFEDYSLKFPNTEFTYLDSELYTPENIAISICKLLIRKAKNQRPKNTKEIWNYFDNKLHYYK